MAAQKQYELVYIASPDATEDQLTELQSLIEGIVTKANGTIDKADVWGRRRLAYQIGRHKEGHYVVLLFSCDGRARQGARSPPEGQRHCHPPPHRPRRRGAPEGRPRQAAS